MGALNSQWSHPVLPPSFSDPRFPPHHHKLRGSPFSKLSPRRENFLLPLTQVPESVLQMGLASWPH